MNNLKNFKNLPRIMWHEKKWYIAAPLDNGSCKQPSYYNPQTQKWYGGSYKDKGELINNRIFEDVLKEIGKHPDNKNLYPIYHFDKDDGYIFIDFDNVFDNTGKLCAEVLEWIIRLNTYTELSVSGDGLHCIVACPDKSIFSPHEPRKENPYVGFVGRNTNKPSGIEIYTNTNGRPGVLTGNVYKRKYDLNRVNVDNVVTEVLSKYNMFKTTTTQKREKGEVREYDDLKSQVLAVADLRGMFEEAYPGSPIKSNLARCPWHNDTSPSLSFFTDKNDVDVCHCHGCNKHLNAIDLFMEINNLSFGEALREMAVELGLDEKEPAPVEVSLPENVVCHAASLNEKYKSEEVAEEEEEVSEEDKEIPFPYHVMSGVAGKFVDIYSTAIPGMPKQWLYMSFLNMFGTLFSCRGGGQVGTAYPKMYMLLLGNTSDGKSESMKQVDNFFRNHLNVGSHVIKGVGSAPGLGKCFVKTGLKHIVLYLDEFQTLLRKAKADTSELLPVISELFDKSSYDNFLKSSKDSISTVESHLSILAASTYNTLQECWNSSIVNIGFDNRFFFVPGKREYGKGYCWDKVSDIDIDSLVGIITNLQTQFSAVKQLPYDKQAQKLFEEFDVEIKKLEYHERLDTLCKRLAVLIALSDGSLTITEEIMGKAIDLCIWQREVREEITPIAADTRTSYFENAIRKELKKRTLTLAQLKHCLKYHIGQKGIEPFLRALDNLKRIKDVEEVPEGHKKTRKYRLL